MSRNTLTRMRTSTPVLLVILGLTLISIGVLLISVPAGLITAGLAAFVLEWRVSGD